MADPDQIANDLKEQAKQNGQTATQDPNSGRVYWGTAPSKQTAKPRPDAPLAAAAAEHTMEKMQVRDKRAYATEVKKDTPFFSGAGKKKDVWKDSQSATEDFINWDQNKLDTFRNTLTLAGYKADNMSRAQLYSAWGDLVGMAAQYGAKGHKISPWDLLKSQTSTAQASEYAQATGPGGSGFVTGPDGQQIYVGPASKTTQSSNVDYTDPDTARAVVNKAMQNFLGRDPTNSEIKQFTDALHAAEAKNPLVTQTTQQFDTTTGQMVGQKSTSTGGVSAAAAGQQAEDKAKGTDEYGSVQAGTTYMNALRQLVYGGPG